MDKAPARSFARLLAKLLAIAYFSIAGWIAYAAVSGLVDAWSGQSPRFADILFALFLGVLLGGALATYFTWLAARLWFRFSATTVRWATGTTLALCSVYVSEAVEKLLDARGMWVGSVTMLVLVIVCAFAYRSVTRKVITWAGLDDPKDLLGQPIGHEMRVRFFCIILGWAVFIAGSGVMHTMAVAHLSSRWKLLVLLPAVLGWLTYRIVLWRMTPPTRPALPAGGFEVVSSSPQPTHLE